MIMFCVFFFLLLFSFFKGGLTFFDLFLRVFSTSGSDGFFGLQRAVSCLQDMTGRLGLLQAGGQYLAVQCTSGGCALRCARGSLGRLGVSWMFFRYINHC